MWDLRELAELIGIVVTVNGLTLWSIKRLLDSQREAFIAQIASLAERDDGQDQRARETREDLAAFKVEAARSFIHREDAVIYFGRFEQKIDSIWNHLMNLKTEDRNGP